MLCFNEYQDKAGTTAVYPGRGEINGLIYTALGLTGEAGEFADKVKKILRDNDGQLNADIRMALIKELGDVLWYASQCAFELGIKMDNIAKLNLEKLQNRQASNSIHGSGDKR